MVEDVAARVPMPQPRRAGRKPSEQMGRIVPDRICVRSSRRDPWHIASHVRGPKVNPRDFVVYCGAAVPAAVAMRRPLNGTGFDGQGFACSACSHLMGMKTVAQRQAEGLNAREETEIDPETSV
jgi:hypothetical protein